MKKLLIILSGLFVALTTFAQVTTTRLESLNDIDPSATYVLGVAGTGFHASGTSNWGVLSTTTPLMYTLTPGATSGVFYATTTIGGTLYYLSVPTSNNFAMKTSKDSVRLGTTYSTTDSLYAIANVGTPARHLRINGTSGLRSYAGSTGVTAFFYKYESASAVAVTGVSFEELGTYLDPGKTFQLQPIITPANATNKSVTYSLDDPTVASVSATGLVTALKPGNTMVTVTTADGNKKAYFAIAVRELSGVIYKKVLSMDSLAVGDTFILIAENAQKASGAVTNSKYLAAADAVINDGMATSTDAAELTLGGTTGAYTISTAAGSLIGCTGSSNELTFGGTTKTTWNITIDATKAVIQNVSASTYRIQYNASGSRFSAYSSNQSAVQIYKRVTAAPADTTSQDTTTVTPGDTTVVPVVPADSLTFNLLQNVSDLHDGDKVFFSTVKSDVNSVMGLYNHSVASSNIRLQNATYSADRHQVTALDTYAYTVRVTNNGYRFVGSDGKYLYMYNENKNLSSTDTDTLSTKAEWVISITDDVASIKNASNQQWLLLYNISGLFCCYNGANTSTKDVVLYASQAPAYQEKVLHPAIATSADSIVFNAPAYDEIDEVFYDSYTLTVTGTDLSASIVPTVTGDTVFKALTTLNPAGGNLTVYFESPVAGTFSGVLTLTSDTVVRTVLLKAVATASDVDLTPHFDVQDTVYISADLADFNDDEQSVQVPVVGNNFSTMIYYSVADSVNTFADAYFALADDDLGRMDRAGGNISVFYYADAAGVYDGLLSMYCYGTKGDESTKVTKNVVLHLVVTDGEGTALTNPVAADKASKMLREGHVYILRDGVLYDTTGRMIR